MDQQQREFEQASRLLVGRISGFLQDVPITGKEAPQVTECLNFLRMLESGELQIVNPNLRPQAPRAHMPEPPAPE